jgi:hypothetical protein
MKTIIYPNCTRNIVASSLAIALFITSSLVALATPDRALMGELTVTGFSTDGTSPSVTVNGERATSGRSISTSSVIATPDNSSAVINLGKTGRIELAPNSSVTLNFDEKTISGSINEGNVKVSSAPGVEVKVATEAGEITNETSKLNVFAFDAATGNTTAENGTLYLNNGKTLTTLQGQDTTTDDDGGSVWVPVAIIGGAVAATIIYIATRDDDELNFISPIR